MQRNLHLLLHRQSTAALGVRRGYAVRALCEAPLSHSPLVWMPMRYCSSTSPTPMKVSLIAQDFLELTPMVLLKHSLQQYTELHGTSFAQRFHAGENHIIIPRAKFDDFCKAANVKDSATALERLADAAIVVSLDDGARVHLRPALYAQLLDTIAALSSTNTTTSIEGKSFLVAECEARLLKMKDQEAALRRELRPAIARAARWRRTVWGGSLLFAGTQLAIISRLTYFDLDWDIMEPVSYIIAIGTSLVFYLYFLKYGVEHTYTEFDQRFLPRKVRQYAPKDFDWAGYEDVCDQLVKEEVLLEEIKRWAAKH